MDWGWWVTADQGMPVLVALIGTAGAVLIALVGQFLSGRNTRAVMQRQLEGQAEHRWNEAKYETFTRVVSDIDQILRYLNDLHRFYLALHIQQLAGGDVPRPPELPEDWKMSFKRLESFPGEMQLLAPETRRLMRNTTALAVGALRVSRSKDEARLLRAITDTQREYTQLLNAMRSELGLENGRATWGMVVADPPKPGRLRRFGARFKGLKPKRKPKAAMTDNIKTEAKDDLNQA